MVHNTSYMVKNEPSPKQLKLVEQVSKNSDIIYVEIDLPFPLSNRDFVHKRLYLCNKEDPELVKKLGLYEKDSTYYVIMIEATQRPEYPPKNSPVRAEAKMNYWLIEEDPNDKNTTKITGVICQNIGGNVPIAMQNKMVPKRAREILEKQLGNYAKHFGSSQNSIFAN